jgi:hypothetical protein
MKLRLMMVQEPIVYLVWYVIQDVRGGHVPGDGPGKGQVGGAGIHWPQVRGGQSRTIGEIRLM